MLTSRFSFYTIFPFRWYPIEKKNKGGARGPYLCIRLCAKKHVYTVSMPWQYEVTCGLTCYSWQGTLMHVLSQHTTSVSWLHPLHEQEQVQFSSVLFKDTWSSVWTFSVMYEHLCYTPDIWHQTYIVDCQPGDCRRSLNLPQGFVYIWVNILTGSSPRVQEQDVGV